MKINQKRKKGLRLSGQTKDSLGRMGLGVL